jgi:hypothetical protein
MTKSAIKFANGETGYQYTDDQTGELTGVEILRTAAGERCSTLDGNEKAQIALLTAEWLTLARHASEMSERAMMIEADANAAKNRLRDVLRHAQGCSKADWDDYCRYEFDANRVLRALCGTDTIEVLSGLIR